MQILVDADACPVIETVEKIAKEHCVPVTLLSEWNWGASNVPIVTAMGGFGD